MNTGFFITLEGIEGVGKSTSVEVIKAFLAQQKIDLLLTREPGGTPVAESIRHLLLTDHDETILPDTELLLFFAARNQHIQHVIKPNLEKGRWVLCDRFVDASYAYQGAGRQFNLKAIEALDQWIVGNLTIDRTILLDAPVEIALPRIASRGKQDRFEQEDNSFFERIRESYLARAAAYPERYRVVDASQTPDQVAVQIEAILSEAIASHG